MSSVYRIFLLAAFLTGSIIVSGCSGPSEQSVIDGAKASLDKKEVAAAVIQIKAALQKYPNSGELRLLLGDTLLKSGDAANAVLELSKAQELQIGNDRALPLLAEAMHAAGQDKKLIEQYGNASLGAPASAAEFKAHLALAYFSQAQAERGQQTLDDALRLAPKNVNAGLLQARLKVDQGDRDQALAAVNQMIADNPKQVQAWLLKGEVLSSGSNPDIDGGLAAFRQAIVIDPQLARAYTGSIRLLLLRKDVAGYKAQVEALNKSLPGSLTARFYLTQVALFDNNLKAAHESAMDLLKTASRSPGVLQLAGTIALRRGDLLQAEKMLMQALQADPELSAARRSLGETYLRSGRFDKVPALLAPLVNATKTKPDSEALGMVAEAYLVQGDMANAELYFSRASKANPGDPRARVALAQAKISAGKLDGGFAELESVAAADKSIYADMALISEKLRSNDLDGAMKAVEHLEGKSSDKPLANLLRGRILFARKDEAGARASFDKALAADPGYFPAIAELAALDTARNKPGDARQRFETLLAREPNNARVMLAVAELRQKMGVPADEVETLLKRAIAAAPEEPAARLALIEHKLKTRRAKAALEVANEANGVFPDDVLLLDALGRAQLAAGDSQQSMATFRKLAAASPRQPEPYMRLASVYAAGKNYAEAAENLRRALEVSPRLLAAQRMLAQVELARKRVPEALQVAKDVQRQRPEESTGYLIESDIQLSQASYDAAIRALQGALKRERSSAIAAQLHQVYSRSHRPADADRFAAEWLAQKPRDAAFLFHLGSMAMERGDFSRAESRYQQVLALRPEDPVALNNVASLLVQLRKPGAVPLAERANQLKPNQPQFMDTLASAYASDNQMQKAIALQRQVVDKDPATGFYRLSLAKLLITAGDRAAARAELDKLALLGGTFQGQPEVSALLKAL